MEKLNRRGDHGSCRPQPGGRRRCPATDSNAVRSHRMHALSVLASQPRSPQLMLLAVTVMAVVGQIEITG